jgi:DNA-binding NarL/FixJ family response regulator
MANDGLLDEVRTAAEAALEARATGDRSEAQARRALTAARAALDGGHPIGAIAAAEAEGERAARDRVGGQVLRSVERSAKKLRDASEEYERTVVQAVRLGLAARDIAARAGVSHGTVAAIARRQEQASAAQRDEAARQPAAETSVDAGASAPEAG